MASTLIAQPCMSAWPSVSDWLFQVGAVLSGSAMLGATLFFFALTLWMIVEIVLVRLQGRPD